MAGYIGKSQGVTQVDGYNKTEADNKFVEGDDTLFVDETNNRVGIGTASPTSKLHVDNTDSQVYSSSSGEQNHVSIHTTNSSGNGQAATLYFKATGSGGTNNARGFINLIQPNSSSNSSEFAFQLREQSGAILERMRIDSSGNLLVGKSSQDRQTVGFEALSDGKINVTRSGNTPALFDRRSNDGEIISLRKDGSTVGSIVTEGGGISVLKTTGGIVVQNSRITPSNSVGQEADATMDLGRDIYRWDDIYATNGTIQTSDRNEKQDIASLTDAEMRVAKRISGLFKKFRWIDSVEEKGDSARTHTGVIAQDVQQAFTDENLDAGDYALFISTTWWETQTEVPAVEAVAEVLDEEGNVITEAVEAKEAYTRTDTYDTAEEAPEGATERTRMGIRYPQLLSFLAAYNEQRFADIEARLDALEAN